MANCMKCEYINRCKVLENADDPITIVIAAKMLGCNHFKKKEELTVNNDMRDRLVELIKDSVDGCANYWAQLIADNLIANGVIVPPCKVGDTVYYFCTTFGKVLPYFVEKLNIEYYDKDKLYYQYEANCYNNEENKIIDGIDFEPDDIGKK